MKFIPFILFFMAALFTACSGSQETVNDPATLPNETPEQQPEQPTSRIYTVATFNTHNFFNMTCDSGACNPGDYEKVYNQQYYGNKLSDTIQSLKQINADVVMLQEIETESCLQDILVNMPEYTASVFGEIGSNASVDVALIAKGTFNFIKKHRADHSFTLPDGSQKKLARELIEAHLTLKDSQDEMILFTTHFVSKATDPDGIRRIEEARTVRSILDNAASENPNAIIIFGGDLNDFPESDPIQAIISDGKWQLASQDVPAEKVQTWKTTSLDHLIHNAAIASHYYVAGSTESVCRFPGGGLGSSDHCALRAQYQFPPTLTE